MTTLPDKEPLLTVSQAAEYLNVSKMTIRRWTNDGSLPCLRVGARNERRFVESELRKLISGPEADFDQALATKEIGGAHHCVVCEDTEHEWDAIADAIISYLAERSQVVFVGDTERKEHLSVVLTDKGVDSKTLTSAGVLRLLSVEESYLLTGTFSADRAIAFVESTILDAFAKGFKRALFVGYVDWVFRGDSTDEESLIKEVMEYEIKLNGMLERYPNVTILCPYVLTRIDAKTIVDALLVHPKLQFRSQIIDGLYSGNSGENSVSIAGC